MCILPESIRKDAVAVGKFIKDEKITTATFPTQMGELVTELLDDAPCLKFVTLGGEKFKHYRNRTSVSYTHLDVYKRQEYFRFSSEMDRQEFH